MFTKRINDYKYGFITGTIFPNEINDKSCSVAIQHYKKNQIMAFWYRKIDTEYYVIIKGCIDIDGNKYSKGDIVVYEPNDIRKIIFLEDTDLVVIRTPGTKEDFYNYSNASELMLLDFINRYYSEDTSYHSGTKINSAEVTVLVQGAKSKLTIRSLESIRRHLPDAHIVLSTWKDTDVTDLDYDTVVFSEDPGACDVVYNGKKYYNNLNRQLVGIKNGINNVKSKYILKIRSDSILLGDNILKCFNMFPNREEEYEFFKKRLVIGETFNTYKRSLNNTTVYMPFNISDWFFFGYTEDIKLLFDIDLQKNEEAINWNYKNNIPYNHYMKLDKIYGWRYDCEQYIMINAFKKKFKIPYYDISDFNDENISLSNNLILNNYSIVTVPMHQIINLKYVEDTLEGVNCAEGEFRYGYKKMCEDYRSRLQ